MVISFPLLVAIQMVCAQIGEVTGRGIAQNLRRHYPRPLLWFAVTLLLVANVINLGADLGAMAAAMKLLLPGPILAWIAGFAVLSIGLEVLLSYDRYAGILKWTTLSLLAYMVVPFVAQGGVHEIMAAFTAPRFTLDKDAAMALVALFGTTISPYLFFWQAGQEVEEQHRNHEDPLGMHPRASAPRLRRMRLDTWFGMAVAQGTALAIVIATAATLHRHGITQIVSADQAAQALRPIAGEFSFALFTLGIVGTGLLAVPILAGSAAYALSETFGWTEGLDRRPKEARAFYAAIAGATLGGALLNLAHVDPMRALYWTAVLNGLLAPPLMVMTMLMARNARVMGRLTITPLLALGGWAATAVMTLIAVVFLFS
jgi:Mn2+/Fe2+ NRAMP family transporter